MATTIPRSDDELLQLGKQVQDAINYAGPRGTSLQISIEDPDYGMVFLTVRIWVRR